MGYSNTIYVAGPAEDLQAIHDNLQLGEEDELVSLTKDRLVFHTETRGLPDFERAAEITRTYRKTTAGITFWAEYGECHGIAVFKVGGEEYHEEGHDVPGDEDDEDAQDEAARQIQDDYRRKIEEWLVRATDE